jgi:hypothetical protein
LNVPPFLLFSKTNQMHASTRCQLFVDPADLDSLTVVLSLLQVSEPMNKPIIISGEASETDSEDEVPKNEVSIKSIAAKCLYCFFFQPLMLTTPIQGAVITGEDSESENGK